MRRKYTLDQLRSMLVGKRWCDFKRPKDYRDFRILCIHGVFFTCALTKFMLRPALRIRSQGQLVVLQYLDATDNFENCRFDFARDKIWQYRNRFIITQVEGYEPVEAAQDIA
jgi:hypothetical protein